MAYDLLFYLLIWIVRWSAASLDALHRRILRSMLAIGPLRLEILQVLGVETLNANRWQANDVVGSRCNADAGHVKRGYVDDPVPWRYSSVRNYGGLPGLFEVVPDWA